MLQPAAIERTLAVLAEFDGHLRERGVPRERLRAVGTAALRRAGNAAELIERARAELGLALEVLPEREEARLSYLAVAGGDRTSTVAVLDVGGGSTEVVLPGGEERFSIPIGAVVATEEHLGQAARGPIAPELMRALVDAAERAMEGLPAGALAPAGGPRPEVVSVGGTASNLGCLLAGVPCFDPGVAEGILARTEQVERWSARLASRGSVGRMSLPVEAQRGSILSAGLVCMGAALRRLSADRTRLSGRGLRHGIVQSLLAPRGPVRAS